MTSAVNREFLAICSAKHLTGSAFTPRHQGPGEREHQTVMSNHLVLMNAVCKAFPQEWAALIPALEYLLETAPRPPFGLSAFDLSCGYVLASATDKRLAPFEVPKLLPETEVAKESFSRFRELYGFSHDSRVMRLWQSRENSIERESVEPLTKGKLSLGVCLWWRGQTSILWQSLAWAPTLWTRKSRSPVLSSRIQRLGSLSTMGPISRWTKF